MPRFTRLKIQSMALFVAVLGLAPLVPAQEDIDLSDHPWIGEMAPEIDLPTVGGEQMSLSDLRGEYVVIHFGTSW